MANSVALDFMAFYASDVIFVLNNSESRLGTKEGESGGPSNLQSQLP